MEAWEPVADAGVPIVALRDNPRLPEDTLDCLTERRPRTTGRGATSPWRTWCRSSIPSSPRPSSVDGAHFVDTTPLFCDDDALPGRDRRGQRLPRLQPRLGDLRRPRWRPSSTARSPAPECSSRRATAAQALSLGVTLIPMRIGVLDIGSNTGHLLIVDAFRGGPPVPAHSFSEPLRLAENLDADGHLTAEGIDRLVKYVVEAGSQAEDKGAERVLAFATSAVREAGNADEVIARVAEASGMRPADPARRGRGAADVPGRAPLVRLVVRAGWACSTSAAARSSSRSGSDETPDDRDVAAARRRPADARVARPRARPRRRCAARCVARSARWPGRCCGAGRSTAPSRPARRSARWRACAARRRRATGRYVRRTLRHRDLVELGAASCAAPPTSRSPRCPASRPTRAHQMRAGAMVAEATMELFGIEELRDLPVGAARGRAASSTWTTCDQHRPRLGAVSMRSSHPMVSLSTSSVYPDGDGSRLRDRGAARLRRRRGHGRPRRRQRRHHRDQGAQRLRTTSRSCRSTRPCLLVTQRVWGTDPWGKLHRSAEMALDVGADIVVVHPPFRWQREYARGFVEGIARLEDEYDVAFAVENMYPWRSGKREFQAYAPGWDPVPARLRARDGRLLAQRHRADRLDDADRATWATGSRTSTSPTARGRSRTST